MKAQLQVECDFQVTEDLGMYLGLPLLHQKVDKETFKLLLDKIVAKLSGCKSHILSFTGRVTLAKSVISSFSVYSMGVPLPRSSTKAFIWGSTDEKKRMHLVNWEQVCKDKAAGALGIKNMTQLNQALLGKLSWRFLTQFDSLWASVVRVKYSLGTGFDIRFWRDVWLLDEPLVNRLAAPSLTEAHLGAKYPDHLHWGLSPDGNYSIRSTCNLISNPKRDLEIDTDIYRRIWKLRVPERVRSFAWLVVRGAILTKVELKRRHLTNVDSCDCCALVQESCLHLFRECNQVRSMWCSIRPQAR
ncbi:hypothetical protein V2J09_003410 [Rumex salicifolius]